MAEPGFNLNLEIKNININRDEPDKSQDNNNRINNSGGNNNLKDNADKHNDNNKCNNKFNNGDIRILLAILTPY